MIDVEIFNSNEPVDISVEGLVIRGENDYTKLKNIPTFNGKPFVGDIREEDPTVPNWAKSSTKPTYTAEELNAIDEDSAISIEYLAQLFE